MPTEAKPTQFRTPCVTTQKRSRRAGTDSAGKRETKCLSPVFQLVAVQPLYQAG